MIIGITASQLKSAAPLLGDNYPGASIVYSLRHINPDYTGDCIRIKRVSDSTTLDVGFDGEGVDEAAITSFCSGTTGYVITWYDQSGNGFNLTTTATDYYIYESGALVTLNGKIAIQCTSTTIPLQSASIVDDADIYDGTTSVNHTGLVIYSTVDGAFSVGIGHSALGILQYIGSTSSSSAYRVFNNATLSYGTSLPAGGTQVFAQAEFNASGNTSDYWLNGSSVDTGTAVNSGTAGAGTITVGQVFGNTFYTADKLQEIVIWNSYVGDMSGIYDNASTYWS